MSRNTAIIDSFVEAWGARDVDRIVSHFTDDAVYVNVPIEPVHKGRDAIRQAIEGFVAMGEDIDFIVHHTAENPATGVVMNERTDRFKIGGEWMDAAVMGVFELRDGKIAAWRDYFDMAELMKQVS